MVNGLLRISIIGAGKTGCAIATGLKRKGFDISGIYSRSRASAEFLARALGGQYENNIYSAVADSEVVFITVPDIQIAAVAAKIKDEAGANGLLGKTFFHCSGALSSDVLKELAGQGAGIGSLHPIQTFADRENGWKLFEGIYFGFEGSNEAKLIAEIIVSALNAKMVHITKEMKPVYHAAASILSNYTVVLSYIAGELLACAGIERETAIKAFSPLLENTVHNIAGLGSIAALTGPIARGDGAVIEGHMTAIAEIQPRLQDIYTLLGDIAVEIAIKKGSIDSVTADKLRVILKRRGAYGSG